jgi:hypothetical protein
MSFHLPVNAFTTPGILLSLISSVKRQKKFLEEKLGPELTKAKEEKDDSLDDNDFKKINRYYGLAVPAILGDALCILRGYKMSLTERLACTYQGAATGLFDDFFDKHDMPDEELRRFIESPESVIPPVISKSYSAFL